METGENQRRYDQGRGTHGSGATAEKVAQLMINLRISGLPVLDRKRQLVGIVTEGDLLRVAETGTVRQRSRGASGSLQAPDWLQNVSNHTRDG